MGNLRILRHYSIFLLAMAGEFGYCAKVVLREACLLLPFALLLYQIL